MSRTKSNPTGPAFPNGEVLKTTCINKDKTLYITYDGSKYSSWKLIEGKYVRQKSAKDPQTLEKNFWNS